MGQLRIAGGGGSVEYRASNTTGPQILQAPDASGTIALLPSGANGAYLARSSGASVAERTAAGAITFSSNISVGGTSSFTGLTTHAGGVSVTGGSASGSGIFKPGSLIIQNHDEAHIRMLPAGTQNNIQIKRTNVNTSSNANAFNVQVIHEAQHDKDVLNVVSSVKDTASTKSVKCFFADCSVQNGNGVTAYGYYTAIGNSVTPNGQSYAFYASGSAPNFFAGGIQCRGRMTVGAGDYNASNADNPTEGVINAKGTTGSSGLAIYGDYAGGVSVRGQRFFKYQALDNSAPLQVGDIELTADNGILITSESATGPVIVQNSDARVKTLTPFSSNAVDVIQALNPGVNGFIAHELQALVSDAVTGTQNETEAIGTIVDYDGTELETNVVEPSNLTYTEQVEATPYVAADPDNGVEEQEATYTTVTRTKTWTPTGTQPVYQGVDQTKLIPLLTKALQEALDKIETLETRLANAGIA